jgi:Tol biopolymer transport system component
MPEMNSPSLSWRLLLAMAAALASLVALPQTGGATMPGANGRIAFERFAETGEMGAGVSIWSMNADGGGAAQMTTGKDSFEATYSPDGSKLAFGRYDEILIAAADGSDPRPIHLGSTKRSTTNRWVANYEDPETGTVYPWVKIEEHREERDTRSEPSFSPDGKALAVVHYTGTSVNAFVCSVAAANNPSCNGTYTSFTFGCESCGSSIEAIDAGTGASLATFAPKTDDVYLASPTYSRSGSVAYVRQPAGFGPSQLLVVASPGAAPLTLAAGNVGQPDFSPDGARVAYRSGNHEIGIVGAAGGAPTTIAVPPPLPSSKAWTVGWPVWSPDGSLIAYGNLGAPGGGGLERFSEGGVFVMRPDGSGMAPIQGEAATPTGWQPLPIAAPAPPAPAVRARAIEGKKKVRLSKKGLGVVGKVVCGSTPCSLGAAGAKLKVGKKRFGVKAIFPKALPAGSTGPLKVKVKGKAMAALRARGAGRLELAISVSEGAGGQALPFAAKLLPPKKQRKRKARG